jgi:DNA-binding NtrC family response regulator
MDSSIENRQTNGNGMHPAHSVPSQTDLSDLSTESRIEALRLLVLAFLREVDSLKETVATAPGRERKFSTLDREVDAFEASLIREALIRSNGNQRDAARKLKIKPSTLNAKMKRLGIAVETTVTKVG